MERSKKGYAEKRKYGSEGEEIVKNWLIHKKDCSVAPFGEVELSGFEGPKIYNKRFNAKTPDLLVNGPSGMYWLEVKRQEAFSRLGKNGPLETGIGMDQYIDYCLVNNDWPIQVYLAFLQDGGPDEHGDPTPGGLYCASLSKLVKWNGRIVKNLGNHGTIFFKVSSLTKIAELDEIYSVGLR